MSFEESIRGDCPSSLWICHDCAQSGSCVLSITGHPSCCLPHRPYGGLTTVQARPESGQLVPVNKCRPVTPLCQTTDPHQMLGEQ